VVKTPSKPGISPKTLQERAETINWLKTLGLPPLPVAPAQDSHKYPKRNKKGEIEYEKDGVTPKSLFSGKNPSYLNECGTPRLVNHKDFQKRLPTDKQLELWFANPLNGIGTLGGWHDTIWLDFDVKQFAISQECESVALEVASHIQTQAGAEPFLERSHSGGWRVGIRVKQKPDFTNFALAPGGKHVGEALGEGRFTVLAPTIGPSGNPYESINRVTPPEVETLGSIGIYPTSTRSKTSVAPSTPILLGTVVPGSIPLEMLGHGASREILNGANPTSDRSEALTLAIREWYGWTNWTSKNGIRVSGDATTLAHYAGSNLGIDSDRVDRILKTVDPTQCHPAALQVGGEESCWKKIRKLDKATFEQQCPAPIKDTIKREWGRNLGSEFANNGADKSKRSRQSGGSNSEAAEGVLPQPSAASEKPLTEHLSQQIDEILNRNVDDSEQDIAFLQLAQDWGRSKREIKEIAEKRLVERELQDTRSERLKDIQRLEQLEKIKLDLEDFLHPNLAKPIKHMARVRRLRPEFFLAGLLPIAASLIGTKGFVRISRGSDDYQLPSVINVGLVGEASSGKSPVVSALMRPLKQLQSELEHQFQQQKADYEEAQKQWESLPKEARGSKPREDEFVTSGDRTLFISEYSREGIVKTHAIHPNGLLIYKSELVAIYKAFNQYRNGRGEDEEFFNSLWDGDMIYRVLANSEKIFIPESAVSQLGGTQPNVLIKEMGNMEDANGRWARYLWVLAPLERRPLSLEPVPNITELLYSIYRGLYFDLSKTIYTLSPEAEKLYLSWHNLLDDKQFSCPQAGLRAVYGKAQGQAARIALVLHCLNAVAAGELPATQIDGRTMKAAIRLMQFFLGQLSIIRAQGEASIKRETGLAAIYREIERLCVRLEGKADVLTARMVQSARIPQLEGVTAAKVVELFKDIVAMGRAQLGKVKRSWGLVIRSVLGGGDSHPPNTPNPTDGSSPEEVVEFAEELLENWQEPEPHQSNGSTHFAEVLELLEEDKPEATAQLGLLEEDSSGATSQQSSISANNPLDHVNTRLEGDSEIAAIDQHFQQNTGNDLLENTSTERYPTTTLCNLQATLAVCTVVSSAYQKGGKVRVISGEPDQVGKTGTIADIDPDYERPYNVVEENYSFSAWFAAEQLQPIETALFSNGMATSSTPQQASTPQYRYCGERPATGTVDIKGQKRSACSSADAPNVATASLTLSRLYTIEAGTNVVILDETHSHPETMCYVRPTNANHWESGIAVKREDLLAQ
jgi:hypothetical protein